jgi:hypothetical protein
MREWEGIKEKAKMCYARGEKRGGERESELKKRIKCAPCGGEIGNRGREKGESRREWGRGNERKG